MKKLAFPLACVLSIYSANAANIVFVSFHQTDSPSANASNPAWGFTRAPDVGYTDLLRNAGHTVTRVLTSGTPNAALLNAADLVIISRSVPSGDYQDPAETAAWNGITAPTMILGGYIIRGGTGGGARLGYSTGETIPDTSIASVTLTAANPNHPIFSGITLGAGNTLSYATQQSDPAGHLERGISVVTSPMNAGGTVLASVGSAGDAALNGMLIGEWQAGATMSDIAPSDTLAGHRLVFLTGSREHAANTGTGLTTSSEIAGVMDLTPQGQQLFLNAVSYMAVPEPSTYALFGLGGMALLLRRRKA
jgi:hypothetical protein